MERKTTLLRAYHRYLQLHRYVTVVTLTSSHDPYDSYDSRICWKYRKYTQRTFQNYEKKIKFKRELIKRKFLETDLDIHCYLGITTMSTMCILFSFRSSLVVWGWVENVPPTIVFGLPTGSAAVEPTGALAVFPGSILHLECLFARNLGNPEWTWTSTFRRYLTGKLKSKNRTWKLCRLMRWVTSRSPTWIINLKDFIYLFLEFCSNNICALF